MLGRHTEAMAQMQLLKPPHLSAGDTIGIFTPSTPANVIFREKYLHGLEVLRRLGFGVVEGELTGRCSTEGYRSGSPRQRAREFMTLILDPEVKGLMATMGGSNSASMIPHLDFDAIRAHPKVICGYSDVTSLHLAILALAGVRTFYGPAVVPSFSEWPDVLEETRDSFLQAVWKHRSGRRELTPPKRWSNHFRDAKTDAWKTEARRFEDNPGWRSLRRGLARAPVVVANLETLVAAAGTPYFPALEGNILLIEELRVRYSFEERALRQLERIGVFDTITGLIVGNPEFLDPEGAPFSYEDLILEIVGADRPYPIITNFDCGHTHPMLTISEMTQVTFKAGEGFDGCVVVEEPMVDVP
jgi:muramoyltetrapeptide carboxypeptidase LdcA involved in peptidoglycan recycling